MPHVPLVLCVGLVSHLNVFRTHLASFVNTYISDILYCIQPRALHSHMQSGHVLRKEEESMVPRPRRHKAQKHHMLCQFHRNQTAHQLVLHTHKRYLTGRYPSIL